MAKVADIRLEIRSALDKAGIELAKMELEALKTKATEANVKIERSFRGPEEALERVRARTEKAGTVVEEVYVPAAVAAERRAMEMRRRLYGIRPRLDGLVGHAGRCAYALPCGINGSITASNTRIRRSINAVGNGPSVYRFSTRSSPCIRGKLGASNN